MILVILATYYTLDQNDGNILYDWLFSKGLSDTPEYYRFGGDGVGHPYDTGLGNGDYEKGYEF